MALSGLKPLQGGAHRIDVQSSGNAARTHILGDALRWVPSISKDKSGTAEVDVTSAKRTKSQLHSSSATSEEESSGVPSALKTPKAMQEVPSVRISKARQPPAYRLFQPLVCIRVPRVVMEASLDVVIMKFWCIHEVIAEVTGNIREEPRQEVAREP
ncbi:uncharacterized protein B0H18DRAFT_955684 [Fomitopsis serialis]|uniref:uncharacterized protein n=1 Tax=Fomitopsis serialis TaxID=139415 RepID=UPI002007908D|nr:uncharacterized protein B0H18DRAFT_955684 [Neoantrodia serialis]KAH9923831.1 hypothetical protein B0H18DRAFT_955684 [Neoantrodia serialis]